MLVNKKGRFIGIQSLSCLSVLVVGMAPVQVHAADGEVDADSMSLMPPARSGECYGKVRVPAQYKTESVNVITKQATNSFAITGAKFKDGTKKVLIQDGYKKLTAVQPVVTKVNDVFQVSPAKTQWVRGSAKGTIPMTDGDKRDLSAAGVNISDVAVGSCIYEHYKAPVTVNTEEQVLVSQASEKIEVQDAKFQKASENVMVKAGYNRIIEVPAVFKEVDERVLVEPATSVWKKGTGPIQRINNLTGEIMCRVDVPAVYKTVQKKVIDVAPVVTRVAQPAEYKKFDTQQLLGDAKVVRTAIPAVYKTMEKKTPNGAGSFNWLERKSSSAANGEATGRVLCHTETPAKEIKYTRTIVSTPGRVVEETIPAKYREVAVQNLQTDAASSSVPIAAVSSTVEKRIKVSDARFEWQPILCETNMTGDVVSRVQQALKDNGYAVGAIDGVLGKGTFRAIERYQGDKSLSRGGITLETMKSLGVSL